MPSHLFGCECLVVHLFLAIQGFNGRGDGKKLVAVEGEHQKSQKLKNGVWRKSVTSGHGGLVVQRVGNSCDVYYSQWSDSGFFRL